MKCENCNSEHDGSYGSGRFCNQKCSRSFSSKMCNKDKTKLAQCMKCDCDILIKKRASVKSVMCDKCKSTYVTPTKTWSNGCIMCGCTTDNKKICNHVLCKKYKIVPTLIEKFGLPESVVGTSNFQYEFQKIIDVVQDQYHNKELSSLELAEHYGTSMSGGNFTKIMKTLGIETRNLSEAGRNAFSNGRSCTPPLINQYKSGWHETWNGKQAYYRSSYELNYALELDSKKIDYDVEYHRISYWDSQQQRQRTAIPDFYLHESNTIIEIKSDYFLDKQNMLDKLNQYRKLGFNTLLIVEGVEYEL